jgi:hypothetical protein
VAVLTIITLALLAAGFAFTLGGMLLRVLGRTGLIFGAAFALAGHPTGLTVIASSAFLWLAGQRHYAARHQEHRSPLARRLFANRRAALAPASQEACSCSNPRALPPGAAATRHVGRQRRSRRRLHG